MPPKGKAAKNSKGTVPEEQNQYKVDNDYKVWVKAVKDSPTQRVSWKLCGTIASVTLATANKTAGAKVVITFTDDHPTIEVANTQWKSMPTSRSAVTLKTHPLKIKGASAKSIRSLGCKPLPLSPVA
jgi:hypothetical protein